MIAINLTHVSDRRPPAEVVDVPPFRDDARLSSAKISFLSVCVFGSFFSGGRYFLITIIFFHEKLQISFAFGRAELPAASVPRFPFA